MPHCICEGTQRNEAAAAVLGKKAVPSQSQVSKPEAVSQADAVPGGRDLMEIGTGVVVKQNVNGALWVVTEGDEPGMVKMEDPYGIMEVTGMTKKAIDLALVLGVIKFCWTLEEAKEWE